MSKPLKVFITYSHKNRKQKNKLITYLDVMRQEGLIDIWHDNEILAGDTWKEEIFSTNLPKSDLLLHLVSADSLASENCNKELAEVLAKKDIRVIFIILESCDWKNHILRSINAPSAEGLYPNRWEPQILGDIQILPAEGKPLNEWKPRSKGWQNVVEGTRSVIHKMQAKEESEPKMSEREVRAASAFRQGNSLLRLGQMERAIEAYSLAIELKPRDADAYNNRGVAYISRGEYNRALKNFNKAIRLKRHVAVPYNNRGGVHLSRGEFDRAIDDLDSAIELQPDYAAAYNNRGTAYHNKGEVDLAIGDFEKAIDLKPDYAGAYSNRGNAYLDKSDFGLSIQDHNRAIELDSNSAEAYTNRGRAFNERHEYDLAIEDFSTAIDLKRDYVEAYNNRGTSYHNTCEFDLAIVDYTKAIQLRPDYAVFYNNRGLAYEKKGDFDCAIKDYNAAIKLRTDYGEAYFNRGNVHSNMGNFDGAIVDYTKAIKLKPDYAEAYNNRGHVYDKRGDFDRAILDLSAAIELKPDLYDAYNNRGTVGIKKGDFDLAIKDYTKAIALKPDNASVYNNRAIAYYMRGSIDYSINDIAKAIELKPNYADAYNNRGHIYMKRGDLGLAIENCDTAIKLQPNYAQAYYNRAEAWIRLREWAKAKEDLIAAKNNGMDIVAAFRNDYRNVAAFERANQVKLPEDIASLVRQGFRDRYPKKEKVLIADVKPLDSPEVFDGKPLDSSEVYNLVKGLREIGTPLGEYINTQPYFGIKTAPTDVFVVDRKTRDKLIAEHPSSDDILKPFLHGRGVRRWQVEPPEQWLIFSYRGIEINAYPAIRRHLEKYRDSLRKRKGKGGWYELQASVEEIKRYAGPKLVCPNLYNTQTFAVEIEGYFCGSTCYIIPTEETWLCGLLNTRTVEWLYAQISQQLGPDELQARSRFIKQIPVPNLNATQKDLIRKIVDYLIYLQNQPTTSGKDLAHANDFVMLKYFERIINGLVYEFYMPDVLQGGNRDLFKHLMAEQLPEVSEIRGDKMPTFRALFEKLIDKKHPVRVNLFFQDGLRPIRIIEDKW